MGLHLSRLFAYCYDLKALSRKQVDAMIEQAQVAGLARRPSSAPASTKAKAPVRKAQRPVPITPPVSDSLVLLTNARRALAEAKSLPDVVRVMAQAAVITDIAKRGAKYARGQEMAAEIVREAEGAANDAAAIRIEAQAKAGEMLKAAPLNRGGRPTKTDTIEGSLSVPTLADHGVTLNESSRWQQIAAIPAPVREAYIEETKATGGEVTTAGLIRHNEPEPARKRKGVKARIAEIVALAGLITLVDPESAARDIDEPLWDRVQEMPETWTKWLDRVRAERGKPRIVNNAEPSPASPITPCAFHKGKAGEVCQRCGSTWDEHHAPS